MAELKVTQHMLDRAKASKAAGWMYFDPVQFLSLSVTESNVYDWIKNAMPDTQEVDVYNEKASDMPWLEVDMKTGKVTGHDGRHRAAAVIKSGGKRLPVAINLLQHDYPCYFTTPYSGHRRLVKKYVDKTDLPRVLSGQFVHRQVLIDPNTLHEFWSSLNKQLEVMAVQAALADHIGQMIQHIASVVQGKNPAPGSQRTCWNATALKLRHDQPPTGNVYLVGDRYPNSSLTITHVFALTLDHRVIIDTLGGVFHPDNNTYSPSRTENIRWQVLKVVPIQEFYHRQVESSFEMRAGDLRTISSE